MSNDEFILSEWEKEKMDYLKEMARIKDAEDKGLERGIEQGIERAKVEMIANMQKDGLSLEVIAKYTGLTVLEVKKLLDDIK